MNENKPNRYLRGIGVFLGFIVLLVLGSLFLGILGWSINLIYGLILLVATVIALFLVPYYLGEKKEIKSKHYHLNKIKK